jgi:hypothetical protein
LRTLFSIALALNLMLKSICMCENVDSIACVYIFGHTNYRNIFLDYVPFSYAMPTCIISW